MADQVIESKFGQWVRDLREGMRLSQSQAAKRVGIDRQQWYRIETGRSGTSRETAIAIADVLKADRAEALYLAGFAAALPSAPPSNVTEFLTALESLGVPGLEFGHAFSGQHNLSVEGYENLIEDLKLVIDLNLRKLEK